MNRRRFIATTLAAAAGLALDKLRVLGRKTIFIPPRVYPLQKVAVWNRLLTTQEMMLLYNKGQRLTFSELTSVDLKVGDG